MKILASMSSRHIGNAQKGRYCYNKSKTNFIVLYFQYMKIDKSQQYQSS